MTSSPGHVASRGRACGAGAHRNILRGIRSTDRVTQAVEVQTRIATGGAPSLADLARACRRSTRITPTADLRGLEPGDLTGN